MYVTHFYSGLSEINITTFVNNQSYLMSELAEAGYDTGFDWPLLLSKSKLTLSDKKKFAPIGY